MKHKDILNLYKTVTEIDPKTGKERRKAVYIGKKYTTDMAIKKKTVIRLWLLFAAALAVYVVPGFSTSSMMGTFYVSVPYMVCLLPLMYHLMAMVELTRMKNPLTEINVQEGPVSIKRMALVSAVLSALWLVCGMVFAFAGDFSATVFTNVICMICAAGFGGLNVLTVQIIGKMTIDEAEQTVEAQHDESADK